MSVHGTQRHRCAERLAQVRLRVEDHPLYRLVGIEVREPQPGSALLTSLDHERLIVAVFPPASDIHGAPHRQVNQHRIDEHEHGIRFGLQLCLRSLMWGSIVGDRPLTPRATSGSLTNDQARWIRRWLASYGSARYAASASASARSAVCTSSSSATSSS